jgi:sortase (surface protein transpeptidase)
LRGEGKEGRKEGRRLQAAPNQGKAQQGRGSKQHSSCSSLKTQQQGRRGYLSIPKVDVVNYNFHIKSLSLDNADYSMMNR